MGLLSLQTFILLLELGRERRRQGKPFVFAMEEPELHIPPGIQRRLVARAVSIAEQTPSAPVTRRESLPSIRRLRCRFSSIGQRASCPRLSFARPLDATASNALRKLCNEDRPRVIEALMQHRVLIPEGRSEYEWVRLLCDVLETGEHALDPGQAGGPSFGTVLGVIPTHDSAVEETFCTLRRLRAGLVPLVDGDDAGNAKISRLQALEGCPEIILQWRDDWVVEDAIGWILSGGGSAALEGLRGRIDRDFATIAELTALFKIKTGAGRLKTNYLGYENVVTVIGNHDICRERAEALLDALTKACLGESDGRTLIERDAAKSTTRCTVLRLSP
jgi:hypothetical protein